MISEARVRQLAGTVGLPVSITLFSTIEIASKALAARATVDPFLLVFIRFFLTGLVLMGVSAVAGERLRDRLNRRDAAAFALNGLVGITLAISLFHLAILQFRNASSSAVVFSANPVFVMVLARFVNGESWNARKWVAVACGGIGVLFFAAESGKPAADSLAGLGLMLLSAFLFALSTCISRRAMARVGAMTMMGMSSLFGSMFLLPVIVPRLSAEAGRELLRGGWLILYIAVAGTAVAYALYYHGIRCVGAQKGSMAFFLKPVLASFLSVVLLSETLNGYMLCGTGLILAGLVVSVAGRRRAAPEPLPGTRVADAG